MKHKKMVIVGWVIVLLIVGCFGFQYLYDINEKEQLAEEQKQRQLETVQAHYGPMVQTQRIALLYECVDDAYQLVGSLGKGEVLSLVEQEIVFDTEYFQCLNGYYVRYQDVLPTGEEIVYSTRHKNYIPFNESIVLDHMTTLYDENGNLILSVPVGGVYPILVKEDMYYGIDYQDRLVWVRKEDVHAVVEQENSTEKIATGIRTYCYHQLYDESKTTCNKIICHSLSQMNRHFQYIKEAGYYTMTMQDMLWYVEGKVNMPYKSVCLTFDDGGTNTALVVDVLEKYDLHATLFLIGYKKADYMISDHLELQSHTYNMHSYGHCNISPRGSAVLCKDKDVVLADLLKSREVLDGAFAFGYPYYEYNDQLIAILKQAGFKMAFIGDEGLVHVGDDPFKISRYTFSNSSTVNELKYWMHRE